MNEPLGASHNFVWLDLLRGVAAIQVLSQPRYGAVFFYLFITVLSIIGVATACWYLFESSYRRVRSIIKTHTFFNH